MTEPSKAAAFFDLDRTLLKVNSGALWMKRERRLRRISFWQMLQATFYLMAYKFGAIDMEHVTLKALQTVIGEKEETVRQWTYQWYEDEVKKHAAPGGVNQSLDIGGSCITAIHNEIGVMPRNLRAAVTMAF